MFSVYISFEIDSINFVRNAVARALNELGGIPLRNHPDVVGYACRNVDFIRGNSIKFRVTELG